MIATLDPDRYEWCPRGEKPKKGGRRRVYVGRVRRVRGGYVALCGECNQWAPCDSRAFIGYAIFQRHARPKVKA